MATLDDGVRNLERFIGLLTVATGELERIARDLTATEKDLSRLEDEGAEHGGGLNDRLEDFESSLEAAEDEAKDAVDDLRGAGREAQETVGEAQERLEEAVHEVEDRVQDVANDVDDAHARLVEQGFEGLGRVVDQVEQDLETAREETTGLTNELVAALEGLEAEAETAWDAAEAALEQATTETSGLETALETAASDGIGGLESEATEIETACSSLEGDLTTIYEGLAQSADTEQQSLSEAIQSAAQEATTFVDASELERLEQPARRVEEEGLAPLSAELAQVAALLAGAAPLAEALPPLTTDLTKCQGIVGTIDELLQAMAG